MACTRCEYLRAQGALLIEKGLMVKARFAAIRAGTLKDFERKALPDHEARITEAIARVESARLALRGQETTNAATATDVPTEGAKRTTARPAVSEPAGKASPAHGKRRVAKAARGSARS